MNSLTDAQKIIKESIELREQLKNSVAELRQTRIDSERKRFARRKNSPNLINQTTWIYISRQSNFYSRSKSKRSHIPEKSRLIIDRFRRIFFAAGNAAFCCRNSRTTVAAAQDIFT